MNCSCKLAVTAATVAALVAGAAAQTMKINGAGATFPNLIYQKWFSEYHKLHGNVEINYQSIGSGGGIQQVIKQTVELIYALQNKIAYGSVLNAAGESVKASVGSVTAAAAEAAKAMPADFRVSITNAPGKGVYPISSFPRILLYENARDKTQAKTMMDFMKWAPTDGLKFAPDLGDAPLPDAVVKLEMAALGHIKVS